VANHGSTIDRFGRTLPINGNGRVSDPISNGIVPSSALAYRLDDRWALGLAVTSPFSFVTQYPTASWTRYDALTSRLTTIDMQPSIAWRPTPWLGLGIGPNVEYLVASLSSALPNLDPRQPDGQETLHATGWNVGFNAGLQLHLGDRLTFGAAYRSGIEHRLSGKLTVSGLNGVLAAQDIQADAGARFRTPWAGTFGLRWQATERLTLNAQAVLQGWSVFDAITTTSPVFTRTPENYRDTLNGAFGADYRVLSGWTIRSGIQYDPTPTSGAARNARVPDGNRWLFAAGTSVQATRRITLDAAVTFVDFQNASIAHDDTAYAGTPVQTPVSLDGITTGHSVVIALGSRLWF
jgi:long-chain fatty acid transport protein